MGADAAGCPRPLPASIEGVSVHCLFSSNRPNDVACVKVAIGVAGVWEGLAIGGGDCCCPPGIAINRLLERARVLEKAGTIEHAWGDHGITFF